MRTFLESAQRLRSCWSQNRVLQGEVPKPEMVMVDFGRGYHNPGTGSISPQFQNALREHGSENATGSNASMQPGHMQETLARDCNVLDPLAPCADFVQGVLEREACGA